MCNPMFAIVPMWFKKGEKESVPKLTGSLDPLVFIDHSQQETKNQKPETDFVLPELKKP